MTLKDPLKTGNRSASPTLGVIYDLDGTLVDSELDFAAMRAEMRLPEGVAILEAMEQMSLAEQARCEEILHRHEAAGAERATLLPGVKELLTAGSQRGWSQAVLTRNRSTLAAAVLARLGLAELLDPVIAREHGPAKPDPWAVHHICDHWGLTPAAVVVVGDYHFDIEAGRRAGARTVLVGPLALAALDPSASGHLAAEAPALLAAEETHEMRRPHLCLASLADFSKLIDWVEGIGLGALGGSC